jgi:hypothetical protein
VLRTPYRDWTPAALLAHFRGPRQVACWPELDAEQASPEKIEGILRGRFEFNGEAYELPNPVDFLRNPSRDVEWLILLHKFYYGPGLGAAFARSGDQRYLERWIELTERWIETVPLDFLPSDVAGRRIQNWIFAHHYFVTSNAVTSNLGDAVDPAFHARFLASLAAQVDHLCEHLAPARNHRTLELYAIFLAAVVLPELEAAPRWLDLARRELGRNIESDLLADGVHCELATDYHHLVLKNFLGVRRLAEMNRVELPASIDQGIQKALDFAMHVHKPDGLVPALSDGDCGQFLDLLAAGDELYGNPAWRWVASRGRRGEPPKERNASFRASGYHILRSDWGDAGKPFADARWLVFDCGPLGQGNHGHLDALSVEIAAYGRSLVVDPGRYTYDESGPVNWRARFRGTAAHNTVQVDGREQTRYEFFGTRFKVRGPAPDCTLVASSSGPEADYLHGEARSHEYDVVHARRIVFVRPHYWIITDELVAADEHEYDVRFHLPASALEALDVETSAGQCRVTSPHLLLAQPSSSGATLHVDEGFVSPLYGVMHAAPVLRFRRRAANAVLHTVLVPFQDEPPELLVRADDRTVTVRRAFEGTVVEDRCTYGLRSVAVSRTRFPSPVEVTT